MDKKIKVGMLMLLLLLLCGCSVETSHTEPKKEETGFVPSAVGTYDCADTAVVMENNQEKQTITFYNLIKKRNYTLNYDGTSKISDKYGEAMSSKQILEGDIVDITFLKLQKKLNTIQLSTTSWTQENVEKFEIDPLASTITVAGDIYQYDPDVLIISNGKQVEMMDINQRDTLAIQGIEHNVRSIVIEKGHGYLRLKNDEYFLGGWIELGQEVIQKITEDMLLTVPEGNYDILLSNNGVEATKKVEIKRDEETELDLGDIDVEDMIKYGNLLFTVSPKQTILYIDGKEVDYSKPISVEYGIHQMIAKADDYQSVTQYIKVGQENASIDVVLESVKKKEESVSANNLVTVDTPLIVSQNSTVSGNSAASAGTGVASADSYKVIIDAPASVEVYIDGSYIGLTPTSFPKTTGPHVITLRKTGYSTRSYTIQVDSEKKNTNYSFSDLIAIN